MFYNLDTEPKPGANPIKLFRIKFIYDNEITSLIDIYFLRKVSIIQTFLDTLSDI